MTATLSASSLVQAVLALLGPTQNQRLLRLHTPLGPNVLLAERMLGSETLGPWAPGGVVGFKFELLALSTNAHLSLTDLIGQPVRLDLLTQQSATVLRPFHGHVTAFALLGSDGGLARYKLTIEPWVSFLAERQDAWVFQDQTVPQIIDAVLGDYAAQGQLAPAWRWDLADPSVYPQRSLCTQFFESDLAFVQRLLAEEGLFCWFEHSAAESGALGAHTLVISDHNASVRPNIQPLVRYTQSAAASFKEDSLTGFAHSRRVAPTALATASWDHRAVQLTGFDAAGDARLSPAGLQLPLAEQPGAYAYEDAAQAQRITQRQLEALQARAAQHRASGGWRQAAVGTSFVLSEHPTESVSTCWATLSVQHRARNNLTAELSTSLQGLLGRVPQRFANATEQAGRAAQAAGRQRASRPQLFDGPANASDEPLYQAQLSVQDASLPLRMAAQPSGVHGRQGDITFARPSAPGQQTAIVVGLGEPLHTDRDNRVKVQFHWQRGSQSAHRLGSDSLASAGASNAPGDHSAGTWVRVSQAWAGANWGAHQTPRLGQEVTVTFIEGDIDRPLITGSAYNGQGQPDAQGNQVAAGAATATGNAAAWFPGNQKAGPWDGHQHPAVLSGHKSQSLDTSASGQGGHNQLVLDDSPGQARITLGTTTANTWLQLGHLVQQNDNQRLAKRGHGFDLGTQGHGALRAAAGLQLSAYARSQGSSTSAQPAEARAAISQLQQSSELSTALADTAQKHNAKLTAEPAPKALPTSRAHSASIQSLSGSASQGGGDASSASSSAGQGGESTDSSKANSDANIPAIQGGAGTVAAWQRPDILLSAPGGIATATPAHSVMSAGATASLVAGQDINLQSQRHTALAVKAGLSLFTYGKAQNPQKPNAETGMQLHAASGSVSVQAQASTVSLAAQQNIQLASTTNAITAGAPQHILLVGGSSGLKISSGNITLTTSGPANFGAGMKILTGGGKASVHTQQFSKPGDLPFDDRLVVTNEAGAPVANRRYEITRQDGGVLRGVTNAQGQIEQQRSFKGERLQIKVLGKS